MREKDKRGQDPDEPTYRARTLGEIIASMDESEFIAALQREAERIRAYQRGDFRSKWRH